MVGVFGFSGLSPESPKRRLTLVGGGPTSKLSVQCIMKTCWCIIVLAYGVTAQQFNGNSVRDFVGQLTNLISQNGGIGNIVSNLQPNFPAGQPDSNGFGVYQQPGSIPLLTGPSYQRPEQAYPGSSYYQSPYQQDHPGFVNALTSIARHDDLKCVPRLLCEVTSGGKVGYAGTIGSSGSSTNRETLVGLLTVLNFIDDSPLLTFGRAALIGYTARGNPRSCVDAYPTCPRDPDALVDYLNNHNGGFFRFFGGAPHQPSYQGYPSHGAPGDHYYGNNYGGHYGNQYPPAPYKKYRYDYKAQQSSPYSQDSAYNNEDPYSAYNYAGANQFYEGRIQNRPYPLLSVEGYDSPLAFQNFQLPHSPPQSQTAQTHNDKLIFPERKGKTLFFPDDNTHSASSSGFFPDRTGTGNLLLSSHGVHYYNGPPDLVNFRDQRSIKFPSRMEFPRF